MVLFRHADFLERKGCYRTALEIIKLLFLLDTDFDPLCSLLKLDVLAIKSKEFKWYQSFWDHYYVSKGLKQLVNANFSIALVTWELENAQNQASFFSVHYNTK